MMKADELIANLAHFCGTEGYTLVPMSRFLPIAVAMTDGALFLAENAGAHWLMDAIASHQDNALQDEMLRDIQFWTLRRHKSGPGADLTCERDAGQVAIKQEIPFTDFPLDEIKLYVEPAGEYKGRPLYVILLPGEH